MLILEILDGLMAFEWFIFRFSNVSSRWYYFYMRIFLLIFPIQDLILHFQVVSSQYMGWAISIVRERTFKPYFRKAHKQMPVVSEICLFVPGIPLQNTSSGRNLTEFCLIIRQSKGNCSRQKKMCRIDCWFSARNYFMQK